MEEDLYSDHRKLLQELQGTTDRDKDKQQEDEQDVECVDTKIWLWDGDNYEQFQSDYLNQIYPYKINKKTVCSQAKFIFHFLSSSLYYWIELQQDGQPEQDKLGSKDTKVIGELLQTEQCENWIAFRRWGQQFNKKEEFLKYEEQEIKYQPPKGQVIHTYTRGPDQFEIVKYSGSDPDFNTFKKRMEVLLLFYIDGVSFICEQVDTWVYYLIFKKVEQRRLFVGMLSKYIFRLSTVKERHRISQVFIMPAYQKSGHGKELIDIVYNISLKDPLCFQITTQIPSFEYQCLRDYKQLEMIVKSKILNLEEIIPMKTRKEMDQNRSLLLRKQNVRKLKQELKIPGHQLQRLFNIIILYKIQKQQDDMVRAHFDQDIKQKIITNRSPFKTRRRLPHLTMYGKVTNLKEFMLEKAKEDMLRNQEEILQIFLETVNGFERVIKKAIKTNTLP